MMKHLQAGGSMHHGGCPGSRAMQMKRKEYVGESQETAPQAVGLALVSRLNQ